MVQGLLDNWLENAPKCKIKYVIYLDWSLRQPNNVVWLDYIPSDATHFTTIHWKEVNKNILVYGKIKTGVPYDCIEQKYSNFSFLKSHLQKCIRKGDENNALKTALHMIKMDHIGFLKRLMIIMIEDVCLDTSFSIVLWLYIVSHKLTLLQRHVEWLLGLVYVLCKHAIKDSYEYNNTKITPFYCLLNSRYLDLHINQYSLLYSLRFRQSYNTTKCDVKLIDKVASCWYSRFKSNESIKQWTIRPINVNLPDLQLENWDLGAIDFHCAKFILQIISEESNLSTNVIKYLMWNHSSNINYREQKTFSSSEINDWNKIKSLVRRKQKYILYKYALYQD